MAGFNPPPETLRAFARNQTDEVTALEGDAAKRGLDPRAGAGAGPINVAGRRRNERMAGAREAATEQAKAQRVAAMRQAGQQEQAMIARARHNKERLHRSNSRQVAQNLVRGFAERHRRNQEQDRVKKLMKDGKIRDMMRDALQQVQQGPVNVRGSLYDDPELAMYARRYGDDAAMKLDRIKRSQAAAQNYIDVMRSNQQANRQAELGDQQVLQGQMNTQAQVAKYGTPEQIQETFGAGATRDAQGNIVYPGTMGAQGGVDQFGRPINQAVDASGAFTGQETAQPGQTQMTAAQTTGAMTEAVKPSPGQQELQEKANLIRSLGLKPDEESSLIRQLAVGKEQNPERDAILTIAGKLAAEYPDRAIKMVQDAFKKPDQGGALTEDAALEQAAKRNGISVEQLRAAMEKNPKVKQQIEGFLAKLRESGKLQ